MKNTIKVIFNLKNDVSSNIGTEVYDTYPKRFYSPEDAWAIEDDILRMLRMAREESCIAPEEDVEYELTLFGKLDNLLFAFLVLDMEKWGNVKLKYLKPNERTSWVLPREYRDVRI